MIETVDKGSYKASYIGHSTINMRALSIVGPFSFEADQPIYGPVPEHKTKASPPVVYAARKQGIVGMLATLTVEIDGQVVRITEVGSVDIPAMQNDAENAKDASSDAFKRCWMRTGLGLQLWVKGDFFLPAQLDKNAGAEGTYVPEDDPDVEVLENSADKEAVPEKEYDDDDPERPF